MAILERETMDIYPPAGNIGIPPVVASSSVTYYSRWWYRVDNSCESVPWIVYTVRRIVLYDIPLGKWGLTLSAVMLLQDFSVTLTPASVNRVHL